MKEEARQSFFFLSLFQLGLILLLVSGGSPLSPSYQIEGKSIIICVGASAFIPKPVLDSGFPFLTYYNLFERLSSFESFGEEDRLAVVGGGPIGTSHEWLLLEKKNHTFLV